MINKEAINQTKLFGLEKYLKELIRLKKIIIYQIRYYLVVKKV